MIGALLVTCALVIYLICMPSALGPAAIRLRTYISGKSLVPMLQLLLIPLCTLVHKQMYWIRMNFEGSNLRMLSATFECIYFTT